MLLLISAKSATDADQAAGFEDGKPSFGGGPLTEIESTYTGFGFLVERTGLVLGIPSKSGVQLSNICLVITGPLLK